MFFSKVELLIKKQEGFKRLLYFISTLFLSVLHSDAQQYSISRSLPGIAIDSILIIDGKVTLKTGDQYLDFTGEIAPFKGTVEPPAEPSFYFGDGKIDSYVTYNDGFLVSINDTLKYFDGTELRIFEVPTERISFKSPKISGCGDEFAIVSEGGIWIWNPVEYIFREIPLDKSVDIISQKCDDWRAYWVSDGTVLYSIIPPSSTRLPELMIDDFKNDEGSISFAIKAYHPEFEHLILEYNWIGSDQDWKRLLNNQFYKWPLPSSDIKGIQFRSSVNQEYYTYSEKYPIINTSEEKTSWFWYFLFIPLLIIAASVYMVSREKKLKSELILLKEKYKLKEEAQSMSFKAQRMKMNPHFLFNAITAIQGLIAAGRNDEARKSLGQYAHLSRHLMRQGESKTIPLENELKFIEDYLQLEQLIFNGNFTYDIVNAAEDDIKIPPMLIQPLIENSIRHGFKSRHSGHLNISLHNTSEDLFIEITDDGIGRKAAETQSSSSDHNGIAIESIRERLRNFGKFRKGELVIQDLNDDEGTATGTRCILKIPI